MTAHLLTASMDVGRARELRKQIIQAKMFTPPAPIAISTYEASLLVELLEKRALANSGTGHE